MNFIARLVDFVFPPRSEEEIVRSLSADTLLGLLNPVLIETTRPATIALLPFRKAAVRAAIHEAKYHESLKAQELLGSVLGDYLAALGEETFEKAVLVPLPLSPARLRERGFNQCERIATHALNGNVVSLSTTQLVRTKNTEHQARLGRAERLTNVRGAFAAAEPCNPARSYIIVDDVITTGATMQAAIDALTEAGATHIIPLSLSR